MNDDSFEIIQEDLGMKCDNAGCKELVCSPGGTCPGCAAAYDSLHDYGEDLSMTPDDSIQNQAFDAVYEDVRRGRLPNQTPDDVSIRSVLESLARNGFGLVKFDVVPQPITRREQTAKNTRESKSPCRSKWLLAALLMFATPAFAAEGELDVIFTEVPAADFYRVKIENIRTGEVTDMLGNEVCDASVCLMSTIGRFTDWDFDLNDPYIIKVRAETDGGIASDWSNTLRINDARITCGNRFDLDENGKLTATDVLWLLKIVAGSVPAPVCEEGI